MKRFGTWPLLLLLALLVGAVQPRTFAGGATAVAPAAPPPTPGSIRPAESSTYPRTVAETIEMPDLRGRTLDYATGIWDDDEPLPQIAVEWRSNSPNAVIVQQLPAPGTRIIPEITHILLTMGNGPVLRPAPSPTPAPPLAAIAALEGTATLLRAPYVQNLTPSSLTLVWTTVEDGASEVHYGTSDLSLTAPASSTYVTTPAPAPYNYYYVHQANLSDLTPDTRYQYQVFTNGANLTPGGTATLRSGKPADVTHFRLAVLGDSGDGSQNQKDVATRLLQLQPDLVVHTGDLVYSQATYDGFEKKFFQVYKDLLTSTWLAPSMGNHDVSYQNGQSFVDVFVNPPNNGSNPAERELYYSFDYGNAHFTILNNYFGMTTVGSAQYTWLRNDLASSSQFWKFVVFHQPPYASDSSQQPHDNAKIVQVLVPLFEQYHVNMVLSGHWHNYERMKPLLHGQVSTIADGGVVYLVTGGGGAGLFGIGSGTLNPRTAAKYSKYHVTLLDINGCSLQLSAVQKVSGASDTFDPSDIFDSYTLNRCDGPPQPTMTPTITPTPAPTAVPTATPVPSGNLLKNGGFELDTNNDGRPDNWGSNTNTSRSSAVVHSGSYAIQHSSTSNAGYTVSQVVSNLTAGTSYSFGGWVNIPATSDAFTFKLQVRWRNSSNSTISTSVVATYSAATSGWVAASASLVAPAGTTNAQVQMVVSSLNATIYADDFDFEATPPSAAVPSEPAMAGIRGGAM